MRWTSLDRSMVLLMAVVFAPQLGWRPLVAAAVDEDNGKNRANAISPILFTVQTSWGDNLALS